MFMLASVASIVSNNARSICWPVPLLLAMSQRRENRDGRVQAGHQIGNRDAGFLRSTAGTIVALAGDRHEARHRLDDEVVTGTVFVWAVLAEAGDRAIDDARVRRGERCVIQSVAGQLPDLVVLDHDIRPQRELAHQRLPGRLREIDRDRTLVAVGGEVVRGLAGVVSGGIFQIRRSPAARVVAAAGTFDLDHIGAQVGEQLRAPRAGQHACQIEHAQVRQGVHRGEVSKPAQCGP
jgi:hypothetical protein